MSETELSIDNREFELFRSLVYEKTGISLRDSKQALLQSRLAKRLRHYGHSSLTEYYEYLKHSDQSGQELQEMINAVTTNKTSFFRESHHFDYLASHLFKPASALAEQGHRSSIRIWSAGCSSGEEPYSIAITAVTNLPRLAAWDVKILATDIDTEILRRAREGVYSRESVSDLSSSLIKQSFLSGKDECADLVRVKPVVQNLVSFGQLNLVRQPWPFQGKFDAIFCRNVIIYFDRDCQRRVVEAFARSLKPNGLFFAGHSENLVWLTDLFEPIGHTAYRLRAQKQ